MSDTASNITIDLHPVEESLIDIHIYTVTREDSCHPRRTTFGINTRVYSNFQFRPPYQIFSTIPLRNGNHTANYDLIARIPITSGDQQPGCMTYYAVFFCDLPDKELWIYIPVPANFFVPDRCNIYLPPYSPPTPLTPPPLIPPTLMPSPSISSPIIPPEQPTYPPGPTSRFSIEIQPIRSRY